MIKLPELTTVRGCCGGTGPRCCPLGAGQGKTPKTGGLRSSDTNYSLIAIN